MSVIKSVCVYCGSSSRVSDFYKAEAAKLGKMMAGNGWDVIYGGGRVGLMAIVADAALAGGGKVVGIIPEHIRKREVDHDGLSELHIVGTMHERKAMMADRADAFVILPGGLGTLDEFFEIITWKQLHLHSKPVILVNSNGYWAELLQVIDKIANEKFMQEKDRELFMVAEKLEDIEHILKSMPPTQKETASELI